MNLADDIKELILLNEVIILPGFGGFISSYHPAEIRKDSRIFEPPSKEIHFDDRMISGSGLLTSHVAKKNNLSEEEALTLVNDYIETLKTELRDKGFVMIEGIGRISKTASGSCSFKQVPDENYLVQSFGLPNVEIPSSKKPIEISNRPLQPKSVPPPVVRERKKIPVSILVLGIILLTAGIVYFSGLFDTFIKPFFVSPEMVSIPADNENKIVFGKQVIDETDTLKQEVNRQLEEQAIKEKALRYEENEKTAEKPAVTVTIPVKKPEPPVTVPVEKQAPPVIKPSESETGHYHVVAGSFTLEDNAIRQKAKLESLGYSPRIVQKRGKYYYVSLQAFDTESAAKAEMERIRDKHAIALWVMYR